MTKKAFFALLLVCGLILSCNEQKPGSANTPKGEIIYHVFQRSFYDSNGDLQGDLNGLRAKLDYLQDLGVTSILLLPLYESDFYHNYFANDFEKIDPEFGTMDDYLALVREVHKRGMKIYLDMETQYITEKHPWWKDAVGNLKSPYSNFFLFDDSTHNTPASMIYGLRELAGFDGKKIKVTTVNLKDKGVLDYNVRLFSYFVDPNKDGKFDDGADGFRLDHAMDHLDNKPTLTNLFQDFWSPLIERVKAVNPQVSFVAEQADWRDYGFDYFSGAHVDRMFGFGVQQAILSFNKQQLIQKADTILGMTPQGKQQIIFIENHDLDRSASVLNRDPAKERVAAALSLLIGGVPSIYYGQEIGMFGKGGFGLYGMTDANDIPRREAFEWNKADSGNGMAAWYRNTGPWWDNTNLKPNDGVSLEEERGDPNSLFNFYKSIIQLRQSNAALSEGHYKTIGNNNESIFTFSRETGSDKVLIAVNLSSQNQEAVLPAAEASYASLYGKVSISQGKFTLAPYEIAVWKVKP
jgi:glycosidase